LLSAYLRYFLPWNLYRLCRLLPAAPLALKSGDILTDLGSGPLTFPIALWLCRPDARHLALEFRCIDRTGLVLEAGKKLFYALAGEDSSWRVRTIRRPLESAGAEPVSAVVSGANVLNELFWKLPHHDPEASGNAADRYARLFASHAAPDGVVLLVEPGIPQAGSALSAMRTALLGRGFAPVLPCPHTGECSFPGGGRSAKWCHFAFDTLDAPPELLKRSAEAGLTKERGTMSFLFAGGSYSEASSQGFPVRIISDPFPVRGGYGRYGCSAQGAVLIAGDKEKTLKYPSGALTDVKPPPANRRDSKSGALLAFL
jgi:hypothetical protein